MPFKLTQDKNPTPSTQNPQNSSSNEEAEEGGFDSGHSDNKNQLTQKSKSIRKKSYNSLGSKSPSLNHSFSNVIKDLFKDNKKQKIQAAVLKHRRDSHSNNSDKKSKDRSNSKSSSKIFEVVKQPAAKSPRPYPNFDSDQSQPINIC